MSALYFIRGPFDPERDVPAGTEAVKVDDNIADAFSFFCSLVQKTQALPEKPLDVEALTRLWKDRIIPKLGETSLGDRMREARMARGLTQGALAKYFKVSRQSLLYWEHNQTRPHINRLPKLADALGVDLYWLLTGEERRPNLEEARSAGGKDSQPHRPRER